MRIVLSSVVGPESSQSLERAGSPIQSLGKRKGWDSLTENLGLPQGWGNFFQWGSVRGFDDRDFEGFQIFEKDLKQLGSNTGWSFQSMTTTYSKCKLLKVGGFVSSNSLLFSTRPPEWSPDEKTLTYRMASLSRDERGQLNRGNFDLVMSKDLVRCLWGFNPTVSARAEVSVVYEDGKSSLGTSSLRTTKDWLYLNVSGYTFSKPTVRIKLTSGVKKKRSS